MLTCRKCGLAAEMEEARFCEECGEPLSPELQIEACANAWRGLKPRGSEANVDVGRPLPDGRGSDREHPLPDGRGSDRERPSGSGSGGDDRARQEYVRAVEATLADGVLDAGDRATLDDTREQLNLSAGEAAALESQAKDAFARGGASPDPAPEAAPPILLEINDNHFYGEGCAGALEFRLVNHTDALIEKILFSVTAKHLGRIDELQFPVVRPNDHHDAHEKIQIVPELAGEHVVNVKLRYRVGGQMHVWVSQPSLMVFAKTTNPSTIVIDKSMHAGRNIGYGLSISDKFEMDVAQGVIRDFNDMISQTYPPTWRPLDLVRRETDGPKPVRVVAELAERRPVLETASLVSKEEDGRMRTLLLGLQEVRIGRHRGKNDIVLRRLPRTKENDELTLQISAQRSHLVIALRPDGLYIDTGRNINATRLDGQLVGNQMKVPLDRPSEIDVAGALRLRLTPYLDADYVASPLVGDERPPPTRGDATKEGIDAERYRKLGSPDALWRMAEDVGLRSLLIERVDNLAGEERYLVIYRWASCGCAVGNELRWARGGLQARHLRILRLGGRLWMESTVEASRLAVNGIQVGWGGAFPLTAGLTLRCAEWEARVEEFRQLWL